MSKPTVFIIHGRDIEPVRELTKFLVQNGLDVRTVTQLATKKGPISIKEIVAHGIGTADIIIGLLTTDEAVALYDSSGSPTKDTGWQPRPNVILELGLAFGIAEPKLILVSLGEVRRITDLDGILFLDLALPESKQNLLSGIASVLERAGKPFPVENVVGDFSPAVRQRWPYYDELAQLQGRLTRLRLGRQELPLIEIVNETIAANQGEDWADEGEYETTAQKFMQFMSAQFPGPGPLVSDSFWNLVVAGFFEHCNTTGWLDDEETWQGTSTLCRISTRGFELIRKLGLLAPPEKHKPRKKRKRVRVPRKKLKKKLRRLKK